jgi:hypothetical protein
MQYNKNKQNERHQHISQRETEIWWIITKIRFNADVQGTLLETENITLAVKDKQCRTRMKLK